MSHSEPRNLSCKCSGRARFGSLGGSVCQVGISCFTAFALLLLSLNLAFSQPSFIVLASNSIPPTVGMEGQMDVALPMAGLITKPGDHRVPMLVRVAATQPHGTFTRYDLRYTGRVPGKHDLREYLFTAEGAPATNLPALTVTIAGLLPNPHDGWLEESAAPVPSLFGGYRAVLVVLGALWVGAFFVIRRVGRHEKPAAVVEAVPRPPSFAERIRPLIERAASGNLTADQKAELERMLIVHWQRRLNLAQAGANELIVRLRLHPEAGELLGALENWLHRPPGSGEVELEKFLAPYRNLPDEAAVPANT